MMRFSFVFAMIFATMACDSDHPAPVEYWVLVVTNHGESPVPLEIDCDFYGGSKQWVKWAPSNEPWAVATPTPPTACRLLSRGTPTKGTASVKLYPVCGGRPCMVRDMGEGITYR